MEGLCLWAAWERPGVPLGQLGEETGTREDWVSLLLRPDWSDKAGEDGWMFVLVSQVVSCVHTAPCQDVLLFPFLSQNAK